MFRCGWTRAVLLGDPPLVDEGLHERLVLGDSLDLAVANRYARLSADVDESEAVAVEVPR